ncbi:DNA endonuclease SmrA [Celerinatantimonas sp. YJH-8]|uniref:DNA endonuclease SmrA n=1 Tax=Celerinatantimonas sp. YJH-8 TaxID=3228714 RepID=UPI0038C988FB
MMNDDFSLFRQQLDDVVPIQQDAHPQITQPHSLTESQLARREAACREPEEQNPLSLSEPKLILPDDLIAYKRDGIQEGVFKKLRLGKYPIGDRLDLHKIRLEQARRDIQRFILFSQDRGHQCVLIIHGKGARSTPPARMKSYVNHWLPQLDQVMAIHSALPMHGGYGAVYVLLRKSYEKKLENRERHARHLG